MKLRGCSLMWVSMGIAVLMFLGAHSVSAAIFRYDGPYQGKVIDAETGEPIVGAVVVGNWDRIYPNVAGWNSELYDVVETVTDDDGRFYLKGLGVLFLSDIDEMSILIFKSGYEKLGHCTWESLKRDIVLKDKILWKGNAPFIKLKKLSREESRGLGVPSPGAKIPQSKLKLYIEEVNRWREWQGFRY